MSRSNEEKRLGATTRRRTHLQELDPFALLPLRLRSRDDSSGRGDDRVTGLGVAVLVDRDDPSAARTAVRRRVDRCRVSTESATRKVLSMTQCALGRSCPSEGEHPHLAAHRRDAFPAILVDDLVRVSRGDLNIGSNNHDSFRPAKKGFHQSGQRVPQKSLRRRKTLRRTIA